MIIAGYQFVLHTVLAKEKNCGSTGHWLASTLVYCFECACGFLSRVPDEIDMMHRHIASSAVVNERGAEMTEAASAFENR